MPTRGPINIDAFPAQYDAKENQRVLESVVRQLTLEDDAQPSNSSSVSRSSGVTPQAPNGALGTTQAQLYKVPQGYWAEVVAASFVNTGGTARDLDVYLRAPSDTPRRIVRLNILGSAAAGNKFTLGDSRWILTEGMTIEAKQDLGTDVEYHLSILERPL